MASPTIRVALHRTLRCLKTAPSLTLALLLCGGGSLAVASFQTSGLNGIPLTTEMHVETSDWWPTKGDAPRNRYAGSAVCAQCHSAIAASYATTPMAHAAVPAAGSEALRTHNSLSLRFGPFAETIVTGQDSSDLTVSDGNSSVSRTLGWALGEGFMGQTYIYENAGSLYETHLSFFSQPQGLDITPGQSRSTPQLCRKPPAAK
jgi:hypothetical protein